MTASRAEFDRNLLVEAGAGSGKTHSLATRMAAGIAAGRVRRRAHGGGDVHAQGRGRTARAVPAGARGAARQGGPMPASGARLESALAGIERLFAGTIHAFCAHLLRERPVDARVAPGFVELDDVEDARLRRRAWRDFVDDARARGDAAMLALLDAGVNAEGPRRRVRARLRARRRRVRPGGGALPPFARGAAAAERVLAGAGGGAGPTPIRDESKCKAPASCPRSSTAACDRRNGRSDIGQLGRLHGRWNDRRGSRRSGGGRMGEATAVDAGGPRPWSTTFQSTTVEPFLAAWRAYLHRLVMAVLARRARGLRARPPPAERRELRRPAARDGHDAARPPGRARGAAAEVPLAVRRRVPGHRPDPGRDLPDAGGVTSRSDEPGPADPVEPFALPLRPGALFVVGDPKQSIYRFRRADIDIYNRVARRITADRRRGRVALGQLPLAPGRLRRGQHRVPAALRATWQRRSLPSFVPLEPVRDRRWFGAWPAGGEAHGTDPARPGVGRDEDRRGLCRGVAHRRVHPQRGRRGAPPLRRLPRADAPEDPPAHLRRGVRRTRDPRRDVSGAGLFCKSPGGAGPGAAARRPGRPARRGVARGRAARAALRPQRPGPLQVPAGGRALRTERAAARGGGRQGGQGARRDVRPDARRHASRSARCGI